MKRRESQNAPYSFPYYLWFGGGRREGGGGVGINFLYILSKIFYKKPLLGFWVSLFEFMTIVHYRIHSSVFMIFTTGTLKIKMIWYPLLVKDTGMTQTWSVESHCSAYLLSHSELTNAQSRPQNLRFLCPLEIDANRFQKNSNLLKGYW